MALAVSLVVLDVTRGILRGTVLAWLTAMTLVICALSLLPFAAVPWGLHWQNDLVPLLLGALALLVVLIQFLRGRGLRTLWPWIAVAAIDLLILSYVNNPLIQHRFTWFWQVILVVPGIFLAFDPVRVRIRQARAGGPVTTSTAWPPPVVSRAERSRTCGPHAMMLATGAGGGHPCMRA